MYIYIYIWIYIHIHIYIPLGAININDGAAGADVRGKHVLIQLLMEFLCMREYGYSRATYRLKIVHANYI